MDIKPEAKGAGVTVAICTWNRAGYLRRAVESVVGQVPRGVEVLVVDNGSTDGTGELLVELGRVYPQVVVVREERLGVSYARNRAMEMAKGDVVVFLDDDGWAEGGWFKGYVDFLAGLGVDGLRRLGCVGGPVRAFFEGPRPGWLGRGFYELDKGPEVCRLVESDAPWGGNVAYSRRAVLEVGGFAVELGRRGGFLGAHEESELHGRLKGAGFENWWLPTASIQHVVPGDRLRLGWQLRAGFGYGRSSAVVRLRGLRGRVARFVYGLGRVLFGPVECVVGLLVCVVGWPFGGGRVAVRGLGRSARVAGMMYQLLREVVGR